MTDAPAETRPPRPQPGASSPSGRRSFLLSRRFAVLLLVALGSAVVGALYIWASLSYTYSDGERAGYVRSFARRGWLCKTWEGEMVVAAIPGLPAETFAFTVRSDETAQAINRRLGAPMRLHYRQHIGIPSRCFGETAFFVDGVAAAEGIPAAPAPRPAAPPTPTAQPLASPAATPPIAR
jgi:hypothetical protein